MKFLSSSDPIIAVSTSNLSNAAIGLIRISGFNNLKEIAPYISFDTEKIKPRYAHFTSIIDKNHNKIDEIILTYFPGPNSYTGENIIELAVHGNLLNIDKILTLFTESSFFKMAEPGEFTYRALKNKKLTLSEVEGLDLFLNANSNFALEQGFSLLSGKLKDSFHELYKAYLNHKSAIELSIDFSEDVGEETAKLELSKTFSLFYNQIKLLHNRIVQSADNLIEPEIVLIGKPNAGKSSLFNYLLNDNRAIVNKTPGTTRDYIKERLVIDGISFQLLDTAGLRLTKDDIENEGIIKALKLIKNGFIKIFLINPQDFHENDLDIWPKNGVDLLVFTHKDLENFQINKDKSLKLLKDKVGFGSMGASGSIEPKIVDLVLQGQNIDNLNEILEYCSFKFKEISSKEPILINRHIKSIKNIYMNTQSYQQILSSTQDIGIIGSELNILGDCISELLGIVSTEDVLNNVFENFCIGK